MPANLPDVPEPPLKLALSDCLTGAEVRYDGSGARSSFPHAALGDLYELTGLCPELAIGMGVPRPPIHLVGQVEQVRVLGVDDHTQEYTAPLAGYAERMHPKLRTLGISGYVFMKNSPSCGLYRVKIYPPQMNAPPLRAGRGAYAARLAELWPELPLEESGRLNDPVLRENFVMRTFAYAHWQALQAAGLTAGRLIAFHSRYKYLLLAHSVASYRKLGRLLSDLAQDLERKARDYIVELMSALANPAGRGGHTNVLFHLQGHLKRALSPAERQELTIIINEYARGEQPLLAVLALLKHHFRRHPDEYALFQTYLQPHPSSAALRRPL